MKPYQIIASGLAGAALVVCVVVWVGWNRTPRIQGRILEVRTLGTDENSSVAIVDFEATNTSGILMQVGHRRLAAVTAGGIRYSGTTMSVFDLRQLFKYFPALGRINNEPLIDRTRIAPGDSVKGMIAARFEMPKHELDLRREIIVEIEDIDDTVSSITQVNDIERDEQ